MENDATTNVERQNASHLDLSHIHSTQLERQKNCITLCYVVYTHMLYENEAKTMGKTRIVGENIFILKKSMEVLTSIIYHRADLYESYRKSTAQKNMKRRVYI